MTFAWSSQNDILLRISLLVERAGVANKFDLKFSPQSHFELVLPNINNEMDEIVLKFDHLYRKHNQSNLITPPATS